MEMAVWEVWKGIPLLVRALDEVRPLFVSVEELGRTVHELRTCQRLRRSLTVEFGGSAAPRATPAGTVDVERRPSGGSVGEPDQLEVDAFPALPRCG